MFTGFTALVSTSPRMGKKSAVLKMNFIFHKCFDHEDLTTFVFSLDKNFNTNTRSSTFFLINLNVTVLKIKCGKSITWGRDLSEVHTGDHIKE